MPPALGRILLAMGSLLFLGVLGILAAAARESVLGPGATPAPSDRRRAWRATAIAATILASLLYFGNKWWAYEEGQFQKRLRSGAWPDMAAAVRVEGPRRILSLSIGQKAFPQASSINLLPDHGKLVHLFLVREPARDVFAHLHPVRRDGRTFEVALPPLPEGRYKILCDLAFAESGQSSTATNAIDIPPASNDAKGAATLEPDPDDSWASYDASAIPPGGSTNPVFKLPGGYQVEWKNRVPERAHRDASLEFEVRDSAGNPAALEPYMGMASHLGVLRADGAVFAHLHPSGNFSMASQTYFEEKKARETGATSGTMDMAGMPAGMDHSKMDHAMRHQAITSSTVYLPYEFPSAGAYRLWAQFKIGGRVFTAVFDTNAAD
jgi:hypothetical protein